MQNNATRFVTKMASAGLPKLVVEDFCRFYSKIMDGETGMIPERDIRREKSAGKNGYD
jgi:hypothetical protein